jgi:uncharacterized protein (TIGR02145 family)
MKHSILLLFAFLIFLAGCKKDKPGTIATLTTTAITSVTSNSAQTGGNITDDGGSGITKRGVVWATHTAPTVADSITNNGTGSGSFTSAITGLNANTLYYVRAYAINATGTAYGNEISFTTSAGIPTVSTTAVSDILPLSAKSGGSITNDGAASITERGVVFATTANPTISNFKIAAGTGTGNFTVTLSPLASQTTYYIRAYATNSHGTAYGNQVQFNAASANTVTDIDGNVYPYVTIGTQNWMTTNLKVTKYKNGDPVTNGLTGYNWATGTAGAYTFPNGEVSRKESLGLYYNIYAIRDSRGVCPAGWHVPTDNDWKALEVNQGMTQVQADQYNDFPGRGTIGAKFLEGGSSGLNIQKAGMVFINGSTAEYYGFNDWGVYWSSTPLDPSSASNIYRGFNLGSPDPAPIARTWIDKTYILSVRCIKD